MRLESTYGSNFILRQLVDSYMVVVECPHCDEDIELPDTAEGLFECPHCDEEFEWGVASDTVHEEMLQSTDFWIGLLVPFLAMCCGIMVSFVIVGDTWDFLLYAILSILLCPILALGIAIYGYINVRTRLYMGATVTFLISAPLCLLLIIGAL